MLSEFCLNNNTAIINIYIVLSCGFIQGFLNVPCVEYGVIQLLSASAKIFGLLTIAINCSLTSLTSWDDLRVN